MSGIGAAILGYSAKTIKISRSCFISPDQDANDIKGARFETDIQGTIRHLGEVVTNEITGKVSRDTIRVRSNSPIYTATTQDNAEEDLIHYDGSLWRVTNVIKLGSTWRATATRQSPISGKSCETKRTIKHDSPHYI